MPSYLEVAKKIKKAIDDGRWEPGTRLPTTDQLAAEYGVSATTIGHAFRWLVQKGHVRTVQGGRRYVPRADDAPTGE